MKTALVTGIKGQDGPYLSRLLIENGYRVFGVDLPGSSSKNLKYLNIEDSVELVQANLLDLSNVMRVIERTGPDEIYNLAAVSSVALSFDQPIGTLEFNIFSVANLLEAIRIAHPKIKFYQASSSEMYGKVGTRGAPVDEESVFHPVSPYGISKCTAHWITVNYREAYGLFAVCGILFNHESALRGAPFVTKKIVNTAVRIKLGLADSLCLGNMGISRDWGYAPVYVEAMWRMLQQEKPQDFVICTGQSHSLLEFTRKVFEKLGLDYAGYVKTDKSLERPIDLESISGDNSRAGRVLGWGPKVDFDGLVERLVEDETDFVKWEIKNT